MKTVYASLALVCVMSYGLNAQMRVPWKPEPVVRNIIQDLEQIENIAMPVDLFEKGLRLKAAMLTLGAQEMHDIAVQMHDSQAYDAAAKLMEQLSSSLAELPRPKMIEKSGKYLRPWFALLVKHLRLMAEHFNALAEVVKTRKEWATLHSLSTRVTAVANIIDHALSARELESEDTELEPKKIPAPEEILS